MRYKHPHILILMTDQQRADFTPMEAHPYVQMSCMADLAEHGVYFQNAYTPAPVCVPGRQAILSGQYARHCGCRAFGHALAPDVMTYPQWFGNHGYFTAAAGKMHFQGPDQMQGWQQRMGLEQVVKASAYAGFEASAWQAAAQNTPGTGKRTWADELRNAGYGEGYWGRHDRYAVDGALLFLDQYFADPDYDRITERPLMLQVSLYAPHFPFICAEDWFSYYLPRVQPWIESPPDDHPSQAQRPIRIGQDISQRQLQRAWAAYCGMISEADAQFARVIERLKHLGVYEDFIIVFLSDHGEMLGQRGIWEKFVFYEAAARVPFMISAPGLGWEARRIQQNVSLLDLYPTLCELAGLPLPDELDGHSHAALIHGDVGEDSQAEVISELYQHATVDAAQRHVWAAGHRLMLKRGSLKYMSYEHPDWPEQLFDLDSDPEERRNLIDMPDYAPALASFRQSADVFRSVERRPAFPVGTGRWVYDRQ